MYGNKNTTICSRVSSFVLVGVLLTYVLLELVIEVFLLFFDEFLWLVFVTLFFIYMYKNETYSSCSSENEFYCCF